MARPLRLEHAGALYHVTARGDRQEDIFFENEDQSEFLSILREVCGSFNWVVHAYCQMANHYHLLLETVDGNLWHGIRQLNLTKGPTKGEGAKLTLFFCALGLPRGLASHRCRPVIRSIGV